jgi:hypothetical protein
MISGKDLKDTREPIDCPLCDGTGKTTGHAVLGYIDSMVGVLQTEIDRIRANLHDIVPEVMHKEREAE